MKSCNSLLFILDLLSFFGLLGFFGFMGFFIPVMKLFDWLNWSNGTSRSASDCVSIIYRFKTSRLICGSSGLSSHCDPCLTSYILWSRFASSVHTCMLVLPHFFSWAHVPEHSSQQPKSQLAFLRLFGKKLRNHFDVAFCLTHYMMSVSFGQHAGFISTRWDWQTGVNIDVCC